MTAGAPDDADIALGTSCVTAPVVLSDEVDITFGAPIDANIMAGATSVSVTAPDDAGFDDSG